MSRALFRVAVAVGIALLAACWVEERPPDDAPELPPAVAVPGEEPHAPDGVAGAREEGAVLVGGRFWAGDETLAFELSGRFVSREAMAVLLDPRGPVGRNEGREWTLGDLLLEVRFGGDGESAVWRVAGPGGVVAPYVQQLRDRVQERSAIHDLGVLPLEVRRDEGEPGARIPPQ